jgi:hypothetical protein
LGRTSLFDTSDGDGGFFDNLANDIQGGIDDLAGDVASTIVSALDLPDFFLIYPMGYCRGNYSPNTTTEHTTRNITGCSKHTAPFYFNSTEMVAQYLPEGVTLASLHWPSAIEIAERGLKIASMTLGILYILGAVCGAGAIFAAAWCMFFGGRIVALFRSVVSLVGVWFPSRVRGR